MEISVFIESIQISPLKIKDFSVEMGNLDLKITIIFILSISTKQSKSQRMEISVITNQFRFLRSKSKIFRSKWEFWDYKSLDYIHHPYRPNERKRNAWRYL